MNENKCPKCAMPLNENGICPSCGYVPNTQDTPDVMGMPEPQTQLADPPQSQVQQPVPQQPVSQQYLAQPYQPAPGAANNGAYQQQPPYQPYNPSYPAQNPQQSANPNPGYGYQQQGYPQQPVNNQSAQGYPTYPQQPYPQPQYPQPPASPQQGNTSGKNAKSGSKKKLLAIGIPAIALILVAVILFTVVIPAIRKSKKDDGLFSIGDSWEVEDQWSFKVNGVYEITDRYTDYNANSDIPDPAAVYVVDYEFKNLGYEKSEGKNESAPADTGINTSSDPKALNMFVKDSGFVDAQGDASFTYSVSDFLGDYKNAAIGDTAHTHAVIGVSHKGDLSYTFEMTTDAKHKAKTHVATFKLTPSAEPTEVSLLRYEIDDNAKKLKIGETWKVDDQWTLKINSISKTDDRTKFSKVDYKVADVYVIDYTYTNINYNHNTLDGLYFFFSTYTKDTAGVKCQNYSLIGVDDDFTPPEYVTPGKTLHCQDVIAVSKSGGFIVDAPMYSDDNHGTVGYHYGFVYED